MAKHKHVKVENRYAGKTSIPHLFELLHEQATQGLTADALSQLHSVVPGDLHRLAWLGPTALQNLTAYCGELASRDILRRYRVISDQRQRFDQILGSGFLSDARRCFVLASAIDQAFNSYADDYGRPETHPRSSTTPPRPRTFFDDTAKPPPPLGQMTPLAMCRKWFRNFWVIGQPAALRGFGRFPVPNHVPLPSRTAQALDAAVENRELRLAAITWRGHQLSDLDYFAAPAGTFAIRGLKLAPDVAALQRCLTEAATKGCHIALLPEVSLDPNGLSALQHHMRTEARRLPALVVVGLAHQQSANSYVNEALVLDARGDALFRHEKLEPFTDGGNVEGIVPRRSTQYLYSDTPVGRLVVNVCRDVRSDIPMILNRALGATLLLVPAYSRKLEFLREEARLLGQRQLAVALGVNPAPAQLDDAAYVYAPIRGESSAICVTQAQLVAAGCSGVASVLIFSLALQSGNRGSLTRVQ